MFEAEVLEGRALLLLAVPAEVCNRAALEGLFRDHFRHTAAACVEDIRFSQPPASNCSAIPSDDFASAAAAGEEVAAVLFRHSEAVRTVLERTRAISSGTAYQLELRRGYLALGAHSLLVEGVLATHAARTEPKTNATSRDAGLLPAPTHTPAADWELRRGAAVTHTPVPLPSTTLLLTFVLLGLRPTPPLPPRPVHGTADGLGCGLVAPLSTQAAHLELTPYMVYQVLCGEWRPRSVVLLPSRTHVRWAGTVLPVTRAVVELDGDELAAHGMCERMNNTVVELVSPLPSCGAVAQSAPVPSVEAQFRLLVRHATAAERTQADHPACIPHPWRSPRGARSVVNVGSNSATRLSLRACDVAHMGGVFVRRWDACDVARSPLNSPASRSPSRTAPHTPRARPYKEHPHRRRRHRSPSPHAVEAEREPGAATSRLAGVEDARGDGVGHGRDVRTATTSPQPVAASTSEFTVPSGAQVGLSMLPAYDSLGPLPADWRPVFSLEYQQTYYVHRDPRTGMESTTWTRPT